MIMSIMENFYPDHWKMKFTDKGVRVTSGIDVVFVLFRNEFGAKYIVVYCHDYSKTFIVDGWDNKYEIANHVIGALQVARKHNYLRRIIWYLKSFLINI